MSPCRHQCSYTEVQGPRTRWVLTSKNISTMSIKHLAGSTLASESFIKLASPLPTPAKAWDCPPCALTSTRPELLSSFGSSSKDIQGPRTWHQGPSAGTRWHPLAPPSCIKIFMSVTITKPLANNVATQRYSLQKELVARTTGPSSWECKLCGHVWTTARFPMVVYFADMFFLVDLSHLGTHVQSCIV